MADREQHSSYYDLLEVSANATMEEIEASYHRIVSYLDPTALAVYSMLSDEEVASRRALLDEAFCTLNDPARRAAYDRARDAGGYPRVLVPDERSGPTVSVGMVRAGPEDELPPMDVDAIFDAGGAAPEPGSSRRAVSELAEEGENGGEGRAASSQTAQRSSVGPGPHESSRVGSSGSAPGRGGFDHGAAAQPPDLGTASRSAPSSGISRAVPAVPRAGQQARAGANAPGVRRSAFEPRPSRLPPAGAKPRRLYPSATIEVTPDTEFSGALLRRLRESAGADLEALAEITKVRRHYLEAVEEHDFDALPAAVYVRGFVTEYARVLGLDPQRVAQSYMALYRRYRGEGA